MDAFGVHMAHRFRAHAAAVADARHAALAFARDHAVPAERLDAIALAVSEATTNVVMHAYRDREDPGTFTLGLDLEGANLLIDVRDEGLGMGPRIDSPGLGLGLPIIANVSDGFAVAPSERGGTWLSMRFDLAG
jgi:anti-sigma regulatory factor (Ser/Thr protein kinase)